MKKIASTILITSMLISHLGVLAPQKAFAVFGAGDVVVDPPNLGQNVSQALDLSKSTLKEALAAAAKRLGNKILNKMLKKNSQLGSKWIRTIWRISRTTVLCSKPRFSHKKCRGPTTSQNDSGTRK
jgi:hypothetical protein